MRKRPKQHTRKMRTGRRVLINRGIKGMSSDKYILTVDTGKPWSETLTKSQLSKRLKELRRDYERDPDKYDIYEVFVTHRGRELSEREMDNIESEKYSSSKYKWIRSSTDKNWWYIRSDEPTAYSPVKKTLNITKPKKKGEDYKVWLDEKGEPVKLLKRTKTLSSARIFAIKYMRGK